MPPAAVVCVLPIWTPKRPVSGGAHAGCEVTSQKKKATWRIPEPEPSVGAAETVVGRTVDPSAGSPSENAPGAAASAATVIWPFVVIGPGTVSPFCAVTVFAPGEPNGVPVPSNAYVADT